MLFTKHHRPVVVWMVALIIQMGSWLNWWATPTLITQASGESVFMCTLAGMQQVRLPPTDAQADADTLQVMCPAMLLLAAWGHGSTPAAQPLSLLPATSPFPQDFVGISPAARYFFPYPARAPPLA